MPSNPIQATQTWLKSVVIAHNLCPFAKREEERGSIRFYVDENTDTEQCLINLIAECGLLDQDDRIATTLLIYPEAFADFDDYLDFHAFAEDLLIAQGYEGIYQLANFHPQYCFAEAAPDDAANYTNRSPYPMLHLLRESDVEGAVTNHPNPENIPQHNIALTRSLGLTAMQALLAACYQMD